MTTNAAGKVPGKVSDSRGSVIYKTIEQQTQMARMRDSYASMTPMQQGRLKVSDSRVLAIYHTIEQQTHTAGALYDPRLQV